MANRCGPGSVLIVHQGEMGTGFCSSIPRYFDRYVQYIDRQPTLELTDVGEYDIEQLYTVLYGPLESGEYYNRKDLNGDGVTDFYKASEDSEGNEIISTVYGRDDEFQKYELSYDDWLEQYGQTEDPAIRDKANQSASDLNSILGGIGNEQEISDYLYGLASGPMPEPTGTGPTVEVDVFQCLSEGGSWLDCTTLGVVLQIPGIPALPSAILGSIFREKTLREIIEDIENAADTVKEVIGDIKDIFDPNVDSKLDEKIKGILTTIVDKVKGIFDGDGSGEVTIGDIDEILKGVGGAILTGVFGVLVETGKDTVEDILGLPPGTLLTTDKLSSDSCFAQGFQMAGDGSDKWNCSDVELGGYSENDCSQRGRVHIPDSSLNTKGSCGGCKDDVNTVPDDPNNPDYSCVAFENPTQNEGDACNTGAPLNAEGKVGPAPDFECIPNEGTTCNDPETGESGNIENGQCNTGTTTTPDCPDGQVRRGGLDDGECVTPGVICFSEPSKYAGDDPNIRKGQFNSEGFCVDPNVGQGSCPNGSEPDYFPEDGDQDGAFEYDGYAYTYDPCDPFGKENSLIGTPITTETGGSCPAGSERDDPFYDSRDTDQSGFFVSNGITYSYDPCNPSSGFSIVGQNVNVCEDQNNLNYGNVVQQPEEPCGDCKSGFDKPQGYTNCTSFEDLCRDQAPGYGPNDDNPACATVVEPCDDPNRQQNPDGSCADVCKDNFDFDNSDINSPTFGKCVPIQEDGGCPEGQSKFDGVNCEEACADDPTIGASNVLCGVVPSTCNDPNAVNDGEDGPCRCKPGFVLGEDGLCFQSGNVCENGATVESGCDTCPDGTMVLDHPDGQCPAQDCSNPAYAAANPDECLPAPPECNDCSCAEYAAANPEECAPAPPPETGGGGGGVGGGAGAFSPFIAGIDYTPQALPTAPAAPQKDYMAELDNLIKRSLFEGIV